MKKAIFVVLMVLTTVACKKGGVCVVERETVNGPVKVCQHGVSFDYDKGQCSTGTFHEYSGEGKTSKERGQATCEALGVRAEGH